MGNFVAIEYPDRDTAERALKELGELQKERAIELADAVVVTRDQEGKVKLHQSLRPAAAGATGGALWGGLIGLLFLAPLFGMALGAATGGAMGAMSDLGVDDKFMKELGGKLEPGSAALMVLVAEGEPDKVLPRMEKFGGEVLQTSLSDEADARLRESLEHGKAATSAS